MPASLAMFLVGTLFLLTFVALVIICYETINAVRQFLEHRATSASWLSREAPGLLDYEADGERASKRFTKELNSFVINTQKLANILATHSKRMQALTKSGKALKGTEKQKRGNQAGKSIDRSAIYIEKRVKLFEALVEEIARNYDGFITAISLDTVEDRATAQDLVTALQFSENATSGATTGIMGYRNSVKSVEQQNLSRTIRVSSKRLGDGLDSILKVFKQYQNNSRRLRTNLENKLR